MCGIAGIVNFTGASVDPSALKRMTDAIAHRGPDGEGFFLDRFAGLGHRRLAVLDLSQAGHQPMASNGGRFAVTYNGEIYNFREIRGELAALGYEFNSASDSEVVLKSWVHWGKECVRRFNGMFAFAVWDSQEQVLHLVRDRYGIKPLYWRKMADRITFASEQRGVLAERNDRGVLDEEGLLEYFTFQNFFTDRTLTKGIRLLPAGTVLSVSREGVASPWKYWDFHFVEPSEKLHEMEYREELARLLKRAVERQHVSDVEIGAYLSGGIDSGAITAISSKSIPSLKTFTCGFDLTGVSREESGFDERFRAETMSALFGTEHYEMVLKASDMERCFDDVVRSIEEPRVGQSYPNYLVARLAGKFVKVVLSGTGGDELFGGYPWRFYRATSASTFDSFIKSYYGYWHRLVSNQQLRRLFSPIWHEVSHIWTEDIFRDVFLQHVNELRTREDYVNHCLYFEARTFLHGLLIVEDKLSMASGLETRVPFLDNDLVDFAMGVPVKLKVRGMSSSVRIDENYAGNKRESYFQKSNDGKGLLRDILGTLVPNSITTAVKQGFSSPDASWFRRESKEFVKRRLCDPRAPIYAYLDFGETQSLMAEHQNGSANRRLLLWSLLSLESLTRQSE